MEGDRRTRWHAWRQLEEERRRQLALAQGPGRALLRLRRLLTATLELEATLEEALQALAQAV